MNDLTSISVPEQDEITALVTRGGQLALEWFRKPHLKSQTANKAESGYDPVTVADTAVEQQLREGIERLFPNDTIIGEEFGESGSGERRWIIDPIDGTRAFITGQPGWGVLVGLYVSNEPIAGWTYLPVLDELYVAVNQESTLTSFASTPEPTTRSMAVSETTALGDAILSCTHPSMFAPGDQFERFGSLESRVKMSRFGGDCMNWVLLADGSIDLVVENQLHPFDIASLVPLIEGAGGVVRTLSGGPTIEAGYVIGAATEALMASALEVLLDQPAQN